jgi:hypothetical protein
MSDIRLKRITVEPLQSPLIIQKGDVKITRTTASTSILDGALVVNGGISISTTYDSVSSTSGGAFTIAGGAGIMKNVYMGKDLTLDSSNGVFRVAGLSEPRIFLDSISNKNLSIAPDGVNKRLELSDTAIHFNITKNSTNSTNGALWIKGGISISSTEDVSNASNGGAMTIAGGVAVGKNVSVAKQIIVGETNSNNPGLTVRYTDQDQIVLYNNGIGYASVNMEGGDLIVDNDDDIVLQSFAGNIDFINTGSTLKLVSVHSDNTEFLQHLHISNTKTSNSSSVGSLLLDGGQSIRNITDASSQTSGGSFTTLGGVAIAKKTFTGDSVGIDVANDKRNKLVVWRNDYDLTQTHDFSGFGSISSGSVLYQVNNTTSNHVFCAGSGENSSVQVLSICGNRDIIISGKDQRYKITGGGLTNNSLSFQSETVGVASSVNFFTASGDTTEANQICIFANGTPNSVTNSEYLALQWDTSRFTLKSNKSGTGELHNLVLSASTIDQIILHTNGSVVLSSDTISSNSSSGTLVLQNGGLSINETTNSTNISNGGGLTVAGGASISKDLYIGQSIVLGMTENINLSERVVDNTYSSLVITSAENMYPHMQLIGDSSVSNTEHSFSFVLYNLGSDVSADKQSLSIKTRDDLSGYDIHTSSSGSGETKPLRLYTSNNNSQLTLDTTGNVGINVESPLYKLDVDGTVHATGRVLFTSSVTSTNSTTGGLVTEGGISISSTRDAESLTRGGALTVAGGASIQKNMVVGGITEFLDTTPSTSVMEAAVIVNGGLSIKSGENSVNTLNGGGLTVAGGGAFTGDLYVGGSINGSGSSSSTYAYLTLTATDDAVNLSTGTLISLGGLTLQSDTNAINISNGGSILTPGGASIGRDVYIGGDVTLTRGVVNYYTEDDNVLNFYDAFNIRRFSIDRASATQIFSVSRYDSLGNVVEKCFEITNSDGNTVFNNTIPSSNKDTASVVFHGGISISKTSNATSLANGGGLTVAGGASISKAVYIGGDVRMSSTTTSDNVSTGALLVAGGVGVSGNLNVLGNTLIVGNLTVNGQTTTVDTTNTSLKDNVFLLNSGPTGSSDSGFMINRYQQDNNIGSGDVVADTHSGETITLPDQTGMTNLQLKLTVGANGVNEYYTGWWVKVSSGFSNNQVRKITGYNGTTKIATLSGAWLNQNPSVGDVVKLYNKPYVGVVYNETLDRFDFGSTVQDPNQTSVIFTDRIPICYASATSVSTQASSSVSSGGLLMSGGISISNTTDSQSVTSGGTFTTLGGGSFGKSVYIGNNLHVNGANMTPSPYDMFSIRTFNAANNQSSFVNITGLIFDSSVCGFDCYLTAKLVSVSNLYVNFHIRGVNKDSSWEIVKTYVGDDTGIQFHITEFGQIQYTTPNYTGFTSLVFRWRALVT